LFELLSALCYQTSMMKDFFKVTELSKVLAFVTDFPPVRSETVPLSSANGRILAENLISDVNLPEFRRSTMDGFAVQAASTFGATEGNPAYLAVKGAVNMGERPDFSIGPGEAAKISTGGMLPEGADGVIMIEHTAIIDEQTIEAYRSAAPGQHVIEAGEDFKKDAKILLAGRQIRPQEVGLLAAFGKTSVKVYKKPIIGILSTGDEIVPIDQAPGPGEIRDINTYTLSGQVQEAGGISLPYGIARDDFEDLFNKCKQALAETDMVLISGGSSVGTRDFTIDVLSALPDPSIIVHGISISPGKPTILAKSGSKAIWGLPGHVVSAMIVFSKVVRPFVEHIGGVPGQAKIEPRVKGRLSRNLSSAQGRVDFVRVRLVEEGGVVWAHPVLGKSGLIHTMVKADGLIEIGINMEGLEKETEVDVYLM